MAHQSPQAASSAAIVKRWRRFVMIVGAIFVVIALAAKLKVSLAHFEKEVITKHDDGITRIVVVLKGENVLSEPVYVPKGKRWYAIASSAEKVPFIRAKFGDGRIVPFSGFHEGAIGPYQFMGPKGEVIFVDIQP